MFFDSIREESKNKMKNLLSSLTKPFVDSAIEDLLC